MQAKQPVNMSLDMDHRFQQTCHWKWHLANQFQIAGTEDRAVHGNCADEAQHFCTANSTRLRQTYSVEDNLGKYVSMGIRASAQI